MSLIKECPLKAQSLSYRLRQTSLMRNLVCVIIPLGKKNS